MLSIADAVVAEYAAAIRYIAGEQVLTEWQDRGTPKDSWLTRDPLASYDDISQAEWLVSDLPSSSSLQLTSSRVAARRQFRIDGNRYVPVRIRGWFQVLARDCRSGRLQYFHLETLAGPNAAWV